MNFSDHSRRCARRREQRIPRTRAESGDRGRLDHRGDIRYGARPRHTGHRKPAQLPRAHVRQRRQRARAQHLDLRAEQIDERLAGALVRHMYHADAGPETQEFSGEMPARALSRRAVSHAIRPRLRQFDEIAQVHDGKRSRHHENQRRVDGERNRRKIVERVVWKLAEQPGIRRVGGGHQHQRIPVGIRMRREIGPQYCAAAGPGVDDDLRIHSLAQSVAEQARHDVGRAAGRKGHDQAERARGIRFCRMHRSHCGKRDNASAPRQRLEHATFSFYIKRCTALLGQLDLPRHRPRVC